MSPETARADEPENLRRFTYACEPALCREKVCCAHFDIAVSAAERERIIKRLPRLRRYCPWLPENADAVFTATPCFLFIKKQANGLCLFNFPANGRDAQDGYYCAIHALALAEGENPYAVKPRGCALWPFLEDGAGNLRVDDETTVFPCLRPCPARAAADPHFTELLDALPPREA